MTRYTLILVEDEETNPLAVTFTTYLDEGDKKPMRADPSVSVTPLPFLKLSELSAETVAPATGLPLASRTETDKTPVSSAWAIDSVKVKTTKAKNLFLKILDIDM